ncbi:MULTISPECIES: DUF1798 family protein [Bacillaceae]|uniref:DUF1798 family protein n=1 Tax=Bacillaceae TaxID=186817 RepID=UPI0015DDAF06|nr:MULTISPECIES: DUF1798 family protein [Bacillaceae]
MENKILNNSNKLLHITGECVSRFENDAKKKEEVDFFNEVKPAFEEAMKTMNEWKEDVLKWRIDARPKYLFPVQIDSTVENFEQLVLQSFYKDSKPIRFKNMKQSVDYVIEQVIDHIRKESSV